MAWAVVVAWGAEEEEEEGDESAFAAARGRRVVEREVERVVEEDVEESVCRLLTASGFRASAASQSVISRWRLAISSTEHLRAASSATLRSRAARAASGAAGESWWEWAWATREALRARSKGKSSSMSGARGLRGLLRRGVLAPLGRAEGGAEEAEEEGGGTSMRTRRMVAAEKGSRQKGQAGVRVRAVFSMMVVQHGWQRTCPASASEGKKMSQAKRGWRRAS